MQHVQNSLPGITLMWNLNLDRVFSIGTVIAGLLAGAFLGSVIVSP